MNLALEERSVIDALLGQPRTRPWAGRQVVGVVTANAVTVAVTLVAWWAASGTGKASEQIGFSSLALVAAVIALASNDPRRTGGRHRRAALRALPQRHGPSRSER